MQTIESLRQLSQQLWDQKKDAEDKARQTVREILQEKGEILIAVNSAYAIVQDGFEWKEKRIKGIRLFLNEIEMTTSIDFDDNGYDMPDWLSNDEVFNEDDDYASVNWTSVLSAILATLEQS